MAFDTPLEADRPGEINLLNTFVRAPVVGTLMWIFGGDVARELEERETRRKFVDTVMETTTTIPCDEQEDQEEDKHEHDEEEYDEKSWPVINDASVVSANGTWKSETAKERRGQRDKAVSSATAALAQRKDFALQCSGDLGLDQINRRKSVEQQKSAAGRQTSWSDESGQSLCEYFDETCRTTPLHAPPSSNINPSKPILKRSNSSNRRQKSLHITEEMHNGSNEVSSSHPHSTFHNHHSSMFGQKGGIHGNSGYVSPQWGWYISATSTPPTSEMFTSKKGIRKKTNKKSSSKKAGNDITESSRNSEPAIVMETPTDAMPPFTKGVKGMGRMARVGWHVC